MVGAGLGLPPRSPSRTSASGRSRWTAATRLVLARPLRPAPPNTCCPLSHLPDRPFPKGTPIPTARPADRPPGAPCPRAGSTAAHPGRADRPPRRRLGGAHVRRRRQRPTVDRGDRARRALHAGPSTARPSRGGSCMRGVQEPGAVPGQRGAGGRARLLGMEIANDLAEGGASKVWLSVRTPPNIILRESPGKFPATLAVEKRCTSPVRVRGTLWPGRARADGDLSEYGSRSRGGRQRSCTGTAWRRRSSSGQAIDATAVASRWYGGVDTDRNGAQLADGARRARSRSSARRATAAGSSRSSGTSACSVSAGCPALGAAGGPRAALHRLRVPPWGLGYMAKEAKRAAKAIARELRPAPFAAEPPSSFGHDDREEHRADPSRPRGVQPRRLRRRPRGHAAGRRVASGLPLPDLPMDKTIYRGPDEVRSLWAAFSSVWDELTVSVEEVVGERGPGGRPRALRRPGERQSQ